MPSPLPSEEAPGRGHPGEPRRSGRKGALLRSPSLPPREPSRGGRELRRSCGWRQPPRLPAAPRHCRLEETRARRTEPRLHWRGCRRRRPVGLFAAVGDGARGCQDVKAGAVQGPRSGCRGLRLGPGRAGGAPIARQVRLARVSRMAGGGGGRKKETRSRGCFPSGEDGAKLARGAVRHSPRPPPEHPPPASLRKSPWADGQVRGWAGCGISRCPEGASFQVGTGNACRGLCALGMWVSSDSPWGGGKNLRFKPASAPTGALPRLLKYVNSRKWMCASPNPGKCISWQRAGVGVVGSGQSPLVGALNASSAGLRKRWGVCDCRSSREARCFAGCPCGSGDALQQSRWSSSATSSCVRASNTHTHTHTPT